MVRLTEPFVSGSPYAARDVHLFSHRIEPHAVPCGEILVDPGEHPDIHQRHHQRGAIHSMPHRFTLFGDRHV